MKLITIISFVLLTTNVLGQNNSVTTLLRFKNLTYDSAVKIKIDCLNFTISGESQDTLIFISPKLGKLVYPLKLKDPCTANIYLMKGDSILSMTSSLILSNETLDIDFSTALALFESIENKNFINNQWVYFDVPNSIMVDEGYKFRGSKNTYKITNTGNWKLFYKTSEYEKNVKELFKKNRQYFFNLYKLYHHRIYISTETLEFCYNELPSKFVNTTIAKLLLKYINQFKILFKSNYMPKFSLYDSVGKVVESEKIIDTNKYVLLEFWASWCGPCRVNIREFSSLARELDSTKFSVILVNLDKFEDKQKWLSTYNSEKWVFSNFNDPLALRGFLASYFIIDAIPYNVLLYKNKIVAKNITTQEFKTYIVNAKTNN